MARYENETQSMIEDPPNLQCRNYPLATSSMVISLTDIPWYPPYTPDGSHYHNCLEIGLCLSGDGMVEMAGSSWRFSEGTLLMVPKGWKELEVTYMPTFVADKTLTFTMKAADVTRA